MPLFKVSFPANAKFLYSLVVDITKFNILPSQAIEASVFTFDDSEALSDDFDYLGYNSQIAI